jgi:hypothetical protein
VDPNIDCDGGSTHSAIIGLGTFGVIVYAAGWVHLQFSSPLFKLEALLLLVKGRSPGSVHHADQRQ